MQQVPKTDLITGGGDIDANDLAFSIKCRTATHARIQRAGKCTRSLALWGAKPL
ncbi:MAG: hypothetical protein CM15mP120_04900 [Pseudomonadota bacterium]|nr:MAG: hypothetical protein CM15mP120_04900 [Pseudomonadota bacterium]